MQEQIRKYAEEMSEELISLRRDFHKYAETAWTEFRTASLVADQLAKLGYEVLSGDEVIKSEEMMGVPKAEVLKGHVERACQQGAVLRYIEKMQGGKTGVVGILKTAQPGPVVALRFDMDANDIDEIEDGNHRPVREGFRSIVRGAMHACGHDGHIAIGLGVAKALAFLRPHLGGTIRIIFQPAEEGVRGARAMVESGIVDDVDYLIGMHLGFLARNNNTLVCGTEGFLATSKLDAVFSGTPAHAGAYPENGKNALLAAATATIGLHGISRHSAGVSRINVGVLQGGSGRNIIPDAAVLKLETRGATTEINQYMKDEAMRIIQGAAAMQGVDVEFTEMGGAVAGKSDAELIAMMRTAADIHNFFDTVVETGDLGASEDFTYFMERVQTRGGKAVYAMVGTEMNAGHHDRSFDFDESVLTKSVALLSTLTMKIING